MGVFFLRREPFGGVLYAAQSGNARYLGKTAFEIVFRISKGLSDEDIVRELGLLYEIDDERKVVADIAEMRRSLIDDKKRKRAIVRCAESATPLPALSAPLEVHWEVTGKCNLRCRHCYNDSHESSVEPSLDQIASVVQELRPTPLKGVIVTGGEPLLRKDIRTVIEMLRPLAHEIVLATNGTLLKEDNVAWIRDLVDTVNVSVDAATKERYEAFRGVPGTFLRCINGLRLLVESGVSVVAQTTVSKANITELTELGSLLLSLGVREWIVRLPIWIGRCVDNAEHFLNRRQLVDLESTFQSIRTKYSSHFSTLNIGNSFIWSYSEPFKNGDNPNYEVSCAAGTIMVAIRPDGRLTPCALFGHGEFCSEPVWGGRFIDEWQNAKCLKAMRNIELRKIQPCFYCSHIEGCTVGCRAKALISGNLLAGDPDCNYVNPL